MDAANRVAEPLRDLPGPKAEILTPREGAESLAPEVAFPTTLEEEASQVAAWFAHKLDSQGPGKPPSAAVILRARAHQKRFVDALLEAVCPFTCWVLEACWRIQLSLMWCVHCEFLPIPMLKPSLFVY